MYKNYILIFTEPYRHQHDEWCDDLWKKMAILYGYKGAHYIRFEPNSGTTDFELEKLL